jgi:hypothetical protein
MITAPFERPGRRPLDSITDKVPPLSAVVPRCKLVIDFTSLETHRLRPLDELTRVLDGEPNGSRTVVR